MDKQYWFPLHGNYNTLPMDTLRQLQLRSLSLDLLKKSEEFSRLFAAGVEMAIRANIGRAKTRVDSELHSLDRSTEIRDADGNVLAVVHVEWDGATARVFLRQLAEPSFIFA